MAAVYEQATTPVASGDSLYTVPITLTNADIKAILAYLATVYGFGGSGGKNGITVGYDGQSNTFFYTLNF